MKKRNQNGFAIVEGLLIVIIVLLVGFIGYYVWHTQKKSDKTAGGSTQTNQAASQKKSSQSDSQSVVAIKEWGVEAPYAGPLSLSYNIGVGSDSNSAIFSSKELTALDVDCMDRGGAIVRYLGTDNAADLGGSDESVSQYAPNAGIEYAHVGNYYYFFKHDQAACGANPDATMNLQQQTNDAVKTLTSKLRKIT